MLVTDQKLESFAETMSVKDAFAAIYRRSQSGKVPAHENSIAGLAGQLSCVVHQHVAKKDERSLDRRAIETIERGLYELSMPENQNNRELGIITLAILWTYSPTMQHNNKILRRSKLRANLERYHSTQNISFLAMVHYN